MARVRSSVDVDPELRRRVKVVAAARDQSVKEWIEGGIREARKITEYTPDEPDRAEDRAWLESDLSKLRSSSLMNGKKRVGGRTARELGAGVGFVVEGGKRRGGR